MKTDVYTKGVLTVIALCLTVLVFQNFDVIGKAHASDDSFNTTSYYPNTMDVNIKSISTYDQLPVKISDIDTYDMLPIKIKAVDTWDDLSVNIKEIGGSSVSSSSGRLNVKCDN